MKASSLLQRAMLCDLDLDTEKPHSLRRGCAAFYELAFCERWL